MYFYHVYIAIGNNAMKWEQLTLLWNQFLLRPTYSVSYNWLKKLSYVLDTELVLGYFLLKAVNFLWPHPKDFSHRILG